MACKCGNKKCKVAALSAKTEALKAAAEANKTSVYSLRQSRQESAWSRHVHALASAESECKQRQAINALGATCPLCQRPVAPYGAPWSADACMINGRLRWRGTSNSGCANWAENEKQCLSLAWDRLTDARNAFAAYLAAMGE